MIFFPLVERNKVSMEKPENVGMKIPQKNDMKSISYFIKRGWSLDTSEPTKLWLFDESGVELLQGPFVEGVDFRLTRDGERRPGGVGFPIGAKCVGRDSVGRLLWLVKERRVWYLKYALQEVDDLEDLEEGGIVDLEYAVPVRVLDEELWKDIPGFEGYQAHPEGEVRVKKTKRIIQSQCRKEYYRSTTINGKKLKIHRLIAMTFVPNPDNLPIVNHLDGNPKNNASDNLEWTDHSGNTLHAYKMGLLKAKGTPSPVKITMKDGTETNYPSMKAAGKSLGIQSRIIESCLAKSEGIYRGKRRKEWLWKVERIKTKNPKGYEERDIQIEGFTHLIARSDGTIISKKNGKIIAGSSNEYRRISSRPVNGKIISTGVHRIIALTFIPNPENKSQVNHLNGDKFDNRCENLEWTDQEENLAHAQRIGIIGVESKQLMAEKFNKPVYQLELDGQIIRRFESVKQAHQYLGTKRSKKGGGDLRALKGGYGWCLVSDYLVPVVNDKFSSLFPELVGRNDIKFDIIRPFVLKGSRPVWKIDIAGNRVGKLDTAKQISEIDDKESEIYHSLNSNFSKISHGHFWSYLTYEEILDPEKSYNPLIPDLVKKALKIPSIEGVTLKKSITRLLFENTTGNTSSLLIRNRPLYQISLKGKIIKAWSGPTKASQSLGYRKDQISHALKGTRSSALGFIWRHMKLQEMCDNVPEEYWE